MFKRHVGVAEAHERNGPRRRRMGNENGTPALLQEHRGKTFHQIAPRKPVPFAASFPVKPDITGSVKRIHVPDRETIVDIPHSVETEFRITFHEKTGEISPAGIAGNTDLASAFGGAVSVNQLRYRLPCFHILHMEVHIQN